MLIWNACISRDHSCGEIYVVLKVFSEDFVVDVACVLVLHRLRLSLSYGLFGNVSNPFNFCSRCKYMGCLSSTRSCVKADFMSKWRIGCELAAAIANSNRMDALWVVNVAVSSET